MFVNRLSGGYRIIDTRWKEEEDQWLREAVEKAPKPDGKVNWTAVAQIMKNQHQSERSGTNCSIRWRRLSSPTGALPAQRIWVQSEEQTLLDAITKHGTGNWAKIANEVGGERTEIACRAHWHKYKDQLLNSREKKGPDTSNDREADSTEPAQKKRRRENLEQNEPAKTPRTDTSAAKPFTVETAIQASSSETTRSSTLNEDHDGIRKPPLIWGLFSGSLVIEQESED